MTKHKWHKEIKAWADGAEIEQTLEKASGWTDWHDVVTPVFYTKGAEFRIKKPSSNRPISNTWLKDLEARIENLERIENLRKEHGAGR